MGSTTSLNIQFDRDPPLYYGGELVKGTVSLLPTDSQLSAKELSLQIQGRAVGTRIAGLTTLIGQTYTGAQVYPYIFYQKRIILAEPSPGEKKFKTVKGQNTWSFEIQLPTSLPPTFTTPQNSYQNYLNVSYTVEASLKKSFLSLIDRKTIIFRPSVLFEPRTPASISTINRQDIKVTVHLPQGIVCIPGKTIEGVIEINNPKHIRIKRIECDINQILEVGMDSCTNSIFKVNLLNIININDVIREETFEIQLPEDLPPSHNYTPDAGSNGATIVVKYALTFLVRVIGILSDFEIVKTILVETNLHKQQKDNEQSIQIPPNTSQENL